MITCLCGIAVCILVDNPVVSVNMSRSSSSSYQASLTHSSLFESSTERKAGKRGDKSPHLPTFKAHCKSFIEGLQRVLLFTRDSDVIDRITADERFSQDIVQLSLTLKSVGLSLVDNTKKREVAYIGVTQ